MPSSSVIADSVSPTRTPSPEGWRWAPAWVLAVVALWPAPGYAEAVMVLGALVAIVKLLLARFRGSAALLSGPAWALTSVLFAAYWLPQALSAVDAVDQARAVRESLADLRYLPFLWLAAMAVADDRGRRLTFGGLGVIMLVWAVDALLEALLGRSPLFSGIDTIKHGISGRGMCSEQAVLQLDRLSGILGPCNLKLGIVLASLSPFALHLAWRRFGMPGWLVAAFVMGAAVLLAGARASWITYALVLLLGGWRLLGFKRLLGVFAAGAVLLGVLGASVPNLRERLMRTAVMLSEDPGSMDTALSGRSRIWEAAWCMTREHPINGVGARGFRFAFEDCDPEAGTPPAWGAGPALHAHQIVLEVLSETGFLGLLLWLAGAAMAWRAWRYADADARLAAHPAMVALVVTVFPFNTHLAFYSTFWGGLTLLLAALYAGSLLNRASAGETATIGPSRTGSIGSVPLSAPGD